MPRIPFKIRTVPFVTDQGHAVPAFRPFVAVQFLGRSGRRVPYPTFLDTGSAYAVIPYRLAGQIVWKDLGGQLIVQGRVIPAEWNGIPCRMGEAELELVNPQLGMRTRVLRIIAKMVSRSAPPNLEHAAILGMSFLAQNHLLAEFDGRGSDISGLVEVV